MKKNKQHIVDNKNGDCFRACLTSILGIPNDKKLPNVSQKDWWSQWDNLLKYLGLEIVYRPKDCWMNGYWIASVKSKNFKNSTHAIVMNGLNVAFDPSTKKRYRTGQSLLGKDVVQGGYSLVVNDASKLHRLQQIVFLYENTAPFLTPNH